MRVFMCIYAHRVERDIYMLLPAYMSIPVYRIDHKMSHLTCSIAVCTYNNNRINTVPMYLGTYVPTALRWPDYC